MIAKLHKTIEGRAVLALCDKDIIGKRFEEGNIQIDLSSEFYKGQEKTGEEVLDIIKKERVNILNVVGEKSVRFFTDKGLISKEHTIRIKNIPHAQAVFD